MVAPPFRCLGSLFNGFLLSMTLVVIADNGFFFLIVWELMSLLSYFLVVTEHEKTDVRYAGLFYLIMTHVGTAFIILTFLISLPRRRIVFVRSLPSSGTAFAGQHENPCLSDGADRFRHQGGHCTAPRLVALCPPGGPVAYLSTYVGRHDQDRHLRIDPGVLRFSRRAVPLVVGICRACHRCSLGVAWA